ncbi:uncharacterized protein LOC135682050 [Rhopilema esculentum]|uniref:uncharacterized protein LOC135682050 n=1 Tax=Rhopilema esculentum TaxID=499914 RepID=UPI0031DC89F1
MSKERASLSSKTYQFTYPSVAVWHDFNDLNLKPLKKKENLAKDEAAVSLGKSVSSTGILSGNKKKSGNMKRKKNANKFVGAFIHPTQFQLEHSVLLPSSRAGIRLQPIKNAPIPRKDEKEAHSLPSVAERPKFCVEERALTFLEEKVKKSPNSSSLWNPNDKREHTELAKEPSLFLDINYGSDGDLDIIEIPDLVRTCRVENIN